LVGIAVALGAAYVLTTPEGQELLKVVKDLLKAKIKEIETEEPKEKCQ